MEQIYEYIRMIHETGSLKNAAEKLHVTQPALSIALKKYEDQIGTVIFDRKTHPIAPTPAGEILLRNIERIFHDERRMQAELSDLLNMTTGDLSIGSTHYVNTCVLPRILNRYMELYPNIRIRLSERSSSEIVKAFIDNEFDVAVYGNRLDLDFALQVPVFHDDLYLVVPNKYLDRSMIRQYAFSPELLDRPSEMKPIPSLEPLETIPFIALLPGDRLYQQAEELFRKNGVRPRACLNVPQSTTAWHMACAGIGFSLTPERLIRSIPPDGADISLFTFRSPLMKRTIYAGCNRNLYLSTATRRLLSLCCSIMKDDNGDCYDDSDPFPDISRSPGSGSAADGMPDAAPFFPEGGGAGAS
jgi:Transcriptional regulator